MAKVQSEEPNPPLQASTEVEAAGALPAVASVRERVFSSAPLSPAAGVISGVELAAAAAKREQKAQLAATASAFFYNSLEAITPEQRAEFLMTVGRFNLLSAEEGSAIVLQAFSPKKDEAVTLVEQLRDDAYINTIIDTRKSHLQQRIQEHIGRVRQLRGPFGNDGEIHAAHTRGDMDEMKLLHKEYSHIGGGHFNPDKDIDADTGRYRAASGSHIDKLQQAIEALGATVTDECLQKAAFWTMLLSQSKKTD